MPAGVEPAAPERRDDRQLVMVAVVLTVAIFLLDAYLPLGIAISALYGVVILLGLFVRIRRFAISAAAATTILTAVGAWISPPGGPVLYAIVNRALTLAGMWITAWLVTRYGNVGRALERSVKDLRDTKFALDQAAIIATTDVKGRITYVNDRFVEISKYSRGELLGQDHRLINSGYHSKEFMRDLWHTIANGRIWRGEIRNRAKDGSYYWVDTTIVPFLDDRRRPYQYMAIRYEITDRKQSEAKLREQAALARLGEMAAVVAHEVKNPIAGIRGALQVIGGRLPDASRDKAIIGDIVARLDSLNDIVQDLLVFARPREPQLGPVALSTLIADTVALLRRDPAQQRLGVEVTGQDPVVQADADQLRTVFLNLLLNAAQAQGSVGTVRLNVSVADGCAAVAIADQGLGIPSDIRERVFEPFFTTKHRGSGLGLPTAKRVIERHHGTLNLECPPSGGTVVTVTLPLR
ncbi:MAG TPA: ATP-binding protein [Vicinamibacterales bacterium]|jgi:PAS domain S-box-containing protein|nr:ATP-binding protein [Vicinamibacterales bacterium]